ncbi:MAG: cupin domain-containing protein [Candidatus Hodarchaeota archaeon]
MKVKYTRIYTDADGESHFEDVDVELQETNFAPPAPPANASSFSPATQYNFLTAPPGWYGDWHPTPHRQIAFCLAGKVEVSVSDGEIRSFGPGDILLAEDTTGKGHLSRVVGSAEALTATVQLPD